MAVQNNTMTEQERARLARQRNPINVGQAAADVVLGGLSVPGAALGDLARFRGAQALGGDTSTLQGGVNPRLDAAQNRISGGLAQLGSASTQAFAPVMQALSGAQNTALGALGAQPRQTNFDVTNTPAAQPAAPVAPTQQAPAPAAPAPVTPVASTSDSGGQAGFTGPQPDTGYTGTGIGVGAQGGEIFRKDVNGVPTFTNVNATPGLQGTVGATGVEVGAPVAADTADLRGFGGFAPGEARAYLDKMAVQDAQERAIRVNERKDAMANVSRIGLQRDAQSNNAYTRRAAVAELNRLDADQQARATELAATQRTGLQATAELQRTNAQGQFGLQQEALRGEAGLAEAELTGQYGLAGREAAAQATTNAAQISAQSGSNLKAQAEAIRLARQQAIAAEYEAAGDFAGRDRALGISQPAASRLTQDMSGNIIALDGRPVTAAEAQAYRQSIGFYKTPTQ